MNVRRFELFVLLLFFLQSCTNNTPVYTITSDNTVSVTSYTYNNNIFKAKYSGNITIPETITIGNKDYSVTSIDSYAFNDCDKLISVILPNTITHIGRHAFSGCKSLTKITIPKSVTSIGEMAFSLCYNLNTINFDAINCNNIKNQSLEFPIFHGCHNISTLNIGDEVTVIPDFLFCKTEHLKTVNFSSSVKSIGRFAFYMCEDLDSITIPNSITAIEEYAFYGCNKLKSISFPNSITKIEYKAFSKCNNLNTITLPNSVTDFDNDVFSECDNLTSIIVPDPISYIIPIDIFKDCNKIHYNEFDNAFYWGNSENPYVALVKAKSQYITSCKINTKCKIICTKAFSGCGSLTTIHIPESIVGIGRDAFEKCDKIEKAEFASIKSLCSISFSNSASNPLHSARHLYINGSEVSNVVIPNTITRIGDYSFYGCKYLKSITIPNSIKEIGNDVFYDCIGLRTLSIPNSVVYFGNNEFDDSYYQFKNLRFNKYDDARYLGNTQNPYLVLVDAEYSHSINKNCKFIGYRAFANSNTTSISIPNTVIYIGERAFENSSLSSITIPNSVKGIGNYAFSKCEYLKSVIIGNSVTEIGSRTFSDCSLLSYITIPNSVTHIGYAAFDGCNIKGTEYDNALYVGNAENPYYVLVKAKSTDIEVCNINRNCIFVYDKAFYDCSKLNILTIPKSVVNIGIYAFLKCNNSIKIYCESTHKIYDIDKVDVEWGADLNNTIK